MYQDYYPEVVQAIPGNGRTIYVYFSDGRIVSYDVSSLVKNGSVFAPLQDDDFFRSRLTVLNHTAAWDISGCFDPRTCIDIDPFELYENGVQIADPLEAVP